MPPQRIRIRACDLYLTHLQTRMPFKYGIATMTRVPHLFLRLQAEVDGRSAHGLAADSLPPKWFTKDPDRAVGDEIVDMIRVIRHAGSASVDLDGSSAFQIWRQLYLLQDEWGRGAGFPPLLTHFGTSLVERALIESACRAEGAPFSTMIRTNRLGLQLEEIHPRLRGCSAADYLPAQPLDQIIVRHTVGLSDPLLDEHIPAENRLEDGLPQSLAASIRAYGLRHFKIKVTGRADHDLDRLEQIARLVERAAPVDYRFSLDGNEQFDSLTGFRAFWETIATHAPLREFVKHLLFVEQPLHRDVALQPVVGELFAQWPDRPPILIDESDGALESVPVALKLGYAGSTHKNCKGLFKGIANRCLLAKQSLENPSSPRLMSGEDLANIGPIAVVQDLAAMAALGVESVERNGHHYFAGLSMFSQEIQEQVLHAHGELYQRSAQGWPTLRIQNGAIRMASLNHAPFGVGFELDVERFTPVADFQP